MIVFFAIHRCCITDSRRTPVSTTQIGLLMYPGMTHLDLTGPEQVLSLMEDVKVHTLWKTDDPVAADTGLRFLPSTTLRDCPALDVIFVGGGKGQVPLMADGEVLTFLREQAARARYVTAVCTGSLLLGAAGLLKGKRATTHWAFTELLALFGATYTEGRVVTDGALVTGGGVTAGIDFALSLVAMLRGDEAARRITLQLEYDPAPPFACGHPRRADPALVEAVRKSSLVSVEQRRQTLTQALQTK